MNIGPQRGRGFQSQALFQGVAVVQVTFWRLLRLPCWGIMMLGMVCSVTIVTRCCHAQIWSPLLGKRLACVNL